MPPRKVLDASQYYQCKGKQKKVNASKYSVIRQNASNSSEKKKSLASDVDGSVDVGVGVDVYYTKIKIGISLENQDDTYLDKVSFFFLSLLA